MVPTDLVKASSSVTAIAINHKIISFFILHLSPQPIIIFSLYLSLSYCKYTFVGIDNPPYSHL